MWKLTIYCELFYISCGFHLVAKVYTLHRPKYIVLSTRVYFMGLMNDDNDIFV